jgi:hypothetical protein
VTSGAKQVLIWVTVEIKVPSGSVVRSVEVVTDEPDAAVVVTYPVAESVQTMAPVESAARQETVVEAATAAETVEEISDFLAP